jgi:hypothetical protein
VRGQVPYRVLNFLTSYINYGGRVTDYIDLRTIDVIMKSFYNERIMEDGYRFDQDGVYYSIAFDENDPHSSYMEYIDMLPLVAGPGIFGLHDNANIACALNETFTIFDTVLSLQVGGAVGIRWAWAQHGRGAGCPVYQGQYPLSLEPPPVLCSHGIRPAGLMRGRVIRVLCGAGPRVVQGGHLAGGADRDRGQGHREPPQREGRLRHRAGAASAATPTQLIPLYQGR